MVTRLEKHGFSPRIKRFKLNYYHVTIYAKSLYEELAIVRKRLYDMLESASLEDERALNYLRAAFDCKTRAY